MATITHIPAPQEYIQEMETKHWYDGILLYVFVALFALIFFV